MFVLSLLTISFAGYCGLSKEFYYEIFQADGVSHYDFSSSPYGGVIAKAWIGSRPVELLTSENGSIQYLDFGGISILFFNIGGFETDWESGDYIKLLVKDVNTNMESFNSDYVLDTDDVETVFDGPSLGIGSGIVVWSEDNHWDSIEGKIIPSTITLSQNYPNPFNPETEISFSLPKEEQVTLSVFNSEGQLVKELVNGRVTAGNHSINFNAFDLNSGIYFYTLETVSTKLSKKMLLIK